MAGIDYTIPGQIRPIQIESPMNAMAQAMQMRAMQESSQMNALKAQEYQRGLENRNKLARIYADPKLIAGSPEQLARIQQEVPDEYQSAAERALKGEDLREKIAARKLSETKTQLEIDNQKAAQLKEAQREVTNFESVQDAINHVNRKLAAGLIDKKHAEYMLAQLPKNPLDFGKWKENTLMSMLTAEQQFTGAQKLRDEQYSEYVYDATDKGEIPMSKADYFASINKQPAAAPAPDTTNTTTPADASMVMPTQAATTVAANGDRVLPAVEKVEGVFGLHPQAVAFYRAGNKEMGDKVQAAHVEKKKSEQLTGDFLNVTVAEDKIAELEKDPTPVNLKKIKNLRGQIRAANEGKAPKISNILKMPEGVKAVDQKYAQDWLEWTQGGGADAAANSAQIKSVLDRLAAGENLTGPSIGLAPDFFNALVNPQALGAKQAVEEVVQRNLRAVLGAQFTQVEGERLISRAFDARLKPQENVKRLRKLFLQMQTAAQQKQAMAEYFEANETLRGFKGKQPKMQDFFDVLTSPDAPPKGSVDVNAPDGKVYRFSSQQAADKFKKDNGIKD